LNGREKIWHEKPSKDDQGGTDRKGEAKERAEWCGAKFWVIGLYVQTAFVAGTAAF